MVFRLGRGGGGGGGAWTGAGAGQCLENRGDLVSARALLKCRAGRSPLRYVRLKAGVGGWATLTPHRREVFYYAVKSKAECDSIRNNLYELFNLEEARCLSPSKPASSFDRARSKFY